MQHLTSKPSIKTFPLGYFIKPYNNVIMPILWCVLFLLSGCASNDNPNLPSVDRSQEGSLHQKATDLLNDGNYGAAIEILEQLETSFPFGRFTEQTQVDLIESYFRNYQFGAARETAERFIRSYPLYPDLDYAYYMRALAAFESGSGRLQVFFPVDLSKRDVGSIRQAFFYFNELIARFPNSRFVEDAKRRMVLLRNQLARNEIHIANFYFERKAYISALNRGVHVVTNFQGSPAVSDALAIMVQAYRLLSMDDLAEVTLKVLHSNFPDHYTLNTDGSFKDQQHKTARSLLNRVSAGLFDPPESITIDNRTN